MKGRNREFGSRPKPPARPARLTEVSPGLALRPEFCSSHQTKHCVSSFAAQPNQPGLRRPLCRPGQQAPYGLAAALGALCHSIWRHLHTRGKMLWKYLTLVLYLGYGSTHPTNQKPLLAEAQSESSPRSQIVVKDRALRGRFLHITGVACFKSQLPVILLTLARFPS